MPIRFEGNCILILVSPENRAEFNDPGIHECVVTDLESETPFHEAEIFNDPGMSPRNQFALVGGAKGDHLLIRVPELPVRRIRPSQIDVDRSDTVAKQAYANVFTAKRGIRIDFILDAAAE